MKRNAPVWAPLWRAHMGAEFPSRLRGEEVAGVDFVMLDADIAGCVVTWGTGDTAQQAARASSLRLLLRDAESVLGTLTAPDEVEYFDRLRHLASLVLEVSPPARVTEWYALVDDVGAARHVAAGLTQEWTPILAAVGVSFRLCLVRHLALRGVEQGLQLFVWPQSGFDNYFEVWRVRSWVGGRHHVATLREVNAELRTTLAGYAGDTA